MVVLLAALADLALRPKARNAERTKRVRDSRCEGDSAVTRTKPILNSQRSLISRLRATTQARGFREREPHFSGTRKFDPDFALKCRIDFTGFTNSAKLTGFTGTTMSSCRRVARSSGPTSARADAAHADAEEHQTARHRTSRHTCHSNNQPLIVQ